MCPKILKEHITYLVDYLEPFLVLANFHMVDYFTKNAFKNCIPKKIREDIETKGYKGVISCIFNDDFTDLPNLDLYAKQSKTFTLKNLGICLKTEDLLSKLSKVGCSDPLKLKLNIFMTSKKSHEVDILSYIAAVLKNISGTTHLIDIGDGKGYLSSMLALHHKIPVLGIDASEVNTNGAVKRVKRLSRVWKSVVASNYKIENVETVTSSKEEDSKKQEKLIMHSTDLYKQVTKYINTNIDLVELISNIFLEKPDGVGIVGLHTCGDLATTSIRIFSKNSNIKTICNVGCCYHLLSERFEENEFCNIKQVEHGFPMSNFLNEKQFKIGRAGRMIAAQSMDRILDKKDLPNEHIFYRALLELVLQQKCNHLPAERRHVGKIRKKCENFVDYSRKALKKLKLNCDITDFELETIFENYKDYEEELYVFYLIRNMLSPIIESLILIDRLLYLHELGIEHSYVVQLFDPVVSPRCYGLISMK